MLPAASFEEPVSNEGIRASGEAIELQLKLMETEIP